MADGRQGRIRPLKPTWVLVFPPRIGFPPPALMPHTILTDRCEGVAVCVDSCPVACIYPGEGTNAKGTSFCWIAFGVCIDCGICQQVCPVDGAIVPEERPQLQRQRG